MIAAKVTNEFKARVREAAFATRVSVSDFVRAALETAVIKVERECARGLHTHAIEKPKPKP